MDGHPSLPLRMSKKQKNLERTVLRTRAVSLLTSRGQICPHPSETTFQDSAGLVRAGGGALHSVLVSQSHLSWGGGVSIKNCFLHQSLFTPAVIRKKLYSPRLLWPICVRTRARPFQPLRASAAPVGGRGGRCCISTETRITPNQLGSSSAQRRED